MSINSAFVVLLVAVVLTACRHGASVQADPDRHSAGVTNPVGYYRGCPSSDSDDPIALTPEQVATDEAMARRLVGNWASADDLRYARYHILTLRDDSGFTVTNGTNQVSGVWRVRGGVLILTEADAQPFGYYGFHAINHLDDHQLVCGIDMSVAGRYTFTR